MFKLLLKDFLVQKKFFVRYIFLFAIISIFATIDLDKKNAILIMGAISIAFIMITTAFAIDDKANSQLIINSLPVSKKDIVLSKYVSILFFGIIGLIVMTLVLIPLKLINFPGIDCNLNFHVFKIVFIYLTLFFSINYPIYFKIGFVKASKYNILMYLAVFFLSYIFTKNYYREPLKSIVDYINNTNKILLNISILAGVLILIIISYFLSLNFYSKRDI